jgi:hypothetical protein
MLEAPPLSHFSDWTKKTKNDKIIFRMQNKKKSSQFDFDLDFNILIEDSYPFAFHKIIIIGSVKIG